MVLLRSQRDARRTYDDLLGPQASPPAPTIAEAALDGSSHGQPEAQPEAASRAEEPVVHAKGRNMARKMNKLGKRRDLRQSCLPLWWDYATFCFLGSC